MARKSYGYGATRGTYAQQTSEEATRKTLSQPNSFRELLDAAGLQLFTSFWSLKKPALEVDYPMLRGTIRDYATSERRPMLRFFALGEDFSHEPQDVPLPEAIASGAEPFRIVGAIAGG